MGREVACAVMLGREVHAEVNWVVDGIANPDLYC